jgi:hypothetical protein
MKAAKLRCKVMLEITVGNIKGLSTFIFDQVTTTMHFQAATF